MNQTNRKAVLFNRLTLVSLVLFLINALGCQSFPQTQKNNQTTTPTPKSENQTATPKKEDKKMSQDYINALRNHDRSILDRARQAPPSLAREIEQVLSTLDAESRELAVELITIQDSENTGIFLLARTADQDPNVSTLASENIGKVINKPDSNEIISVIPKRDDPFIRGKLYMEGGKGMEDGVLENLRRVSASETDEDAKLKALAAKVKRGGQSERAEFLNIVRNTAPDDALKIQDLLLYIANPNLAKGLISWLDKNDEIMRIGSDRQNMMARMKDVAVWTAHLLKVKLAFETTHLKNYTDEEIDSTRKILATLAD